jgi:hypothetical protein
MTSQEIKAIALRFASIYIIIQFLFIGASSGLSYAYALTRWTGNSTPPVLAAIAIGAFSILLPIIMAFLLWRQSTKLIQSASTVTSTEVSNTHFISTLTPILAGIGIFLIGFSIPDLIISSASIIRESSIQSSGMQGDVSLQTLLFFFGTFAQFIFGVTLILGRNGWSNLIFKLKYAGLQ